MRLIKKTESAEFVVPKNQNNKGYICVADSVGWSVVVSN